MKCDCLALSGDSLQKALKFVVVGVGILIPIIFGYWRYRTTSEPNMFRDAIGWGFLSIPFSSGLWLSTTRIGKRHRCFSFIFIFLCALVHIIFAVYPLFFLPIVVFTYVYAIYSLFEKAAE